MGAGVKMAWEELELMQWRSDTNMMGFHALSLRN